MKKKMKKKMKKSKIEIRGKDYDKSLPQYPWPAPKPNDLISDDFNRIWNCIKTWDINVPEVYEGYRGSTGNHVMSILFSLGKHNISDYECENV